MKGRRGSDRTRDDAAPRPSAADVAYFAMADGPQRQIADYAARGRARATAFDADLRRDLRQCLEVLGRDAVQPEARLALDDITAEYKLRRQEPPFGDYPELLKGFFAAVEATCRSYSPDDLDRINADLYDEYSKAHSAKN